MSGEWMDGRTDIVNYIAHVDRESRPKTVTGLKKVAPITYIFNYCLFELRVSAIPWTL